MKKGAYIITTLLFLLGSFTDANVIASTSSAYKFPSYAVMSYPETRSRMETTITWDDGATETIEIADKGRIYLNGGEMKAVGFCILAFATQPSASVANKMLDWCQSKGIRFMTILFKARQDNDAKLEFWLPKLYAHKMFAVVWILPSSGGLDKAGLLDPTVYENGFKATVDKIITMGRKDLVIAFILSDEWDVIANSFGIIQSELISWFDDVDPYVRSYLYANDFNRPVGYEANGGSATWASTLQFQYSDFVFRNFHPAISSTSTLNSAWNDVRQVWEDAGKTGYQVWIGSGGYGTGENGDNSKFTPELLTHMLAKSEISGYFIWYLWEGWNNGVENHYMFNMNGEPYPWTETLAPYFS